MKNYELDATMLPNVWVTWDTTKNGAFNARYWLHCQTGAKQAESEAWMGYKGEADFNSRPWYRSCNIGLNWQSRNNPHVLLNSNSRPYMMYAKYHEDIDRLEIAAVTIDTSRKEIARDWKYAGTRMFVGKDKSVVDESGCPVQHWATLYKGHYYYNPKDAIRTVLRLECNDANIVKEFKKFLGGDYFTIGNGSSVKADYPYKIKRWYETKQKTRSAGKQQKLTDELVAMPLGDTKGFGCIYPPRVHIDATRYGTTNMTGVVYFERVNTEWSVLRSFYRNDCGELVEEWRMYINDDGRNRIVSVSDGDWTPSNQIRSTWRNYSYFANRSEAYEKCNRIKYVLAAFKNEVSEVDEVDFLVTALRFPEIEQLIKLGYSRQAFKIARSTYPKAGIKQMFGGYYNDKEKNLLRKIGMTKHQIDTYMNARNSERGYYCESERGLAYMRKMFCDDLSHMDSNSFDEYLEAARDMCRSFYGDSFDRHTDALNLDKSLFFKNLVRLSKKHPNVFQLASDTMSDYRGLNPGTAPAVDWYFDNYSDLVRIHDAITELKRAQLAERRAMWNMSERERLAKEEKKREELDEQRKAYEYEDGNYIIRLPKTLSEIIDEGSIQRICIGGYTSRHATGATNLFFLRKKSAPDTPFYAIEMSNSKNIVQIHGYCNKWLGNDPEAIPTVVRWLRKNGILCDNKILTCKAKGYSSCNDYVPMPVVD